MQLQDEICTQSIVTSHGVTAADVRSCVNAVMLLSGVLVCRSASRITIHKFMHEFSHFGIFVGLALGKNPLDCGDDQGLVMKNTKLTYIKLG